MPCSRLTVASLFPIWSLFCATNYLQPLGDGEIAGRAMRASLVLAKQDVYPPLRRPEPERSAQIEVHVMAHLFDHEHRQTGWCGVVGMFLVIEIAGRTHDRVLLAMNVVHLAHRE